MRRHIAAYPPPPSTLTLTIPEVATILRIGRSSAYEAVKAGDIPSLRVGRRLMIPSTWLAQQLGVDVANLTPATVAEIATAPGNSIGRMKE